MKPHRPRFGRALLPLLLLAAGACADDTNPAAPDTQPRQTSLGVYEFTLSVDATGQARASAAPLAPASGGRLALTPATAAGGITLTGISAGSFTRGSRQSGGVRYVFATFRATNATGAPQNNVSFVAVRTAQSMGETPFTEIRRASGAAVLADQGGAALAQAMKPTGAPRLTTDNQYVSAGADVLQAFTEAEVAGLSSAITGGGYAFPYGFVVRNPSTPNSRLLPVSGTADGIVTLAFILPLQPTAGEDIFTFSFRGLAVADSRTAITQSLEEQGSAATMALNSRALALGATQVNVFGGGTYAGPGFNPICTPLRTAGTAAQPLASLSSPAAQYQSISPSAYGTAPVFVSRNVSFTTTYSLPPTGGAAAFVVNSPLSGRYFVGNTYGGAGTNTISAPAGSYFPGEMLTVSVPRIACGSRAYTYQYRVGSAAASGAFPVSRQNYLSLHGWLDELIASDLDRDGVMELVTFSVSASSTNPASTSMLVARDDRQGSYTVNQAIARPAGLQQIKSADVNGDGYPDVVGAATGGLFVFLNQRDGRLAAAQSVGAGSTRVYPGDVDGDGDVDLVTISQVLLNRGDGSFAVSQTLTSTGVSARALADMNADGRLDLVTAAGNMVYIFPGDGAGGFAQPTASYNLGTSVISQAVTVGDVTGDGSPDAVVNTSNGTLHILRNQGGTSLTLRQTVASEAYPEIILSDLRGNGVLDMLVASHVLRNDGTGSFSSVQWINYDHVNAVVDVNGDGRLDRVAAADRDIMVYPGQP